MNIIGTMVGMSLMASASPMVMNMAIAPAEAAKRAENFAVAETAAVVFEQVPGSSQQIHRAVTMITFLI